MITGKIATALQSIDPETRVYWAVRLTIASVIAWPATSLTIFRSEQQGILALSWIAFIFTLLNIVITTDVRREQEGS